MHFVVVFTKSYYCNRQVWYFVTKNVLTYCEKNIFYWSRKTFEIQGWRLRICKIFEITVKGQNIFWEQNAFSTFSWRFLISNRLDQLEFKLEKKYWDLETCRNSYKIRSIAQLPWIEAEVPEQWILRKPILICGTKLSSLRFYCDWCVE